MFGTTITITGGNIVDNAQMCSVVQAALQNAGMTNVSLDASQAYEVSPENDVVNAMRALNPDLFDTPIRIEGVYTDENWSMTDGLRSLQHDMASGNLVAQPPVWGGTSSFFSDFSPNFGQFFGTPQPSLY